MPNLCSTLLFAGVCSIIFASCAAYIQPGDLELLTEPGFEVATPKPLDPGVNMQPVHKELKVFKPKSKSNPAEVKVYKAPLPIKTNSVILDNDYGNVFLDKQTSGISLTDKYKPWGAAALPKLPKDVIIDKVDDELFTVDGEIHSYDQKTHQDGRQSLRPDNNISLVANEVHFPVPHRRQRKRPRHERPRAYYVE